MTTENTRGNSPFSKLANTSAGTSSWYVNSPTAANNNNRKYSSSVTFYKTKLCPQLIRGKCSKGPGCVFAHADSELRSPPNLTKTKMCPHVRRGERCPSASEDDMLHSCPFAHTVQELRHTEDLFKTKLCHMWKKGKCTAGDICRHAHGPEELFRHRRMARWTSADGGSLDITSSTSSGTLLSRPRTLSVATTTVRSRCNTSNSTFLLPTRTSLDLTSIPKTTTNSLLCPDSNISSCIIDGRGKLSKHSLPPPPPPSHEQKEEQQQHQDVTIGNEEGDYGAPHDHYNHDDVVTQQSEMMFCDLLLSLALIAPSAGGNEVACLSASSGTSLMTLQTSLADGITSDSIQTSTDESLTESALRLITTPYNDTKTAFYKQKGRTASLKDEAGSSNDEVLLQLSPSPTFFSASKASSPSRYPLKTPTRCKIPQSSPISTPSLPMMLSPAKKPPTTRHQRSAVDVSSLSKQVAKLEAAVSTLSPVVDSTIHFTQGNNNNQQQKRNESSLPISLALSSLQNHYYQSDKTHCHNDSHDFYHSNKTCREQQHCHTTDFEHVSTSQNILYDRRQGVSGNFTGNDNNDSHSNDVYMNDNNVVGLCHKNYNIPSMDHGGTVDVLQLLDLLHDHEDSKNYVTSSAEWAQGFPSSSSSSSNAITHIPAALTSSMTTWNMGNNNTGFDTNNYTNENNKKINYDFYESPRLALYGNTSINHNHQDTHSLLIPVVDDITPPMSGFSSGTP